MTPEQFAIIDSISRYMSEKYAFAYYTPEDIYQECFILALEAMPRYDGKRPLENFLRVHLRNRLLDLRRDKFYRYESTTKDFRKKLVVQPMDINDIREEDESNLVVNPQILRQLSKQEIMGILDRELEVEYRLDYLRILQGVKIDSIKKNKLVNRILEILVEYGHDLEGDL